MQQSFSINAKTCTLKNTSHQENDSQNGILDVQTKYIIPIYQRPYSWKNEQINKFVSDIFTSFHGIDGSSEPMFIGTMQLSVKNQTNEQNIIDGQQRLTTFLIFLHVLKSKFQDCNLLKDIHLDWLSTKVNNGKQQESLQILLNSHTFQESETNIYMQNAFLINQIIDTETSKIEWDSIFDVQSFVEYLTTEVYFVIIETQAGLTKTLQIFNTINTTGLDLSGNDVFKIKMFEYLKDVKKQGDDAFIKISSLYEKIETYNQKKGKNEIKFERILNIYRYILIAKYDLNRQLYDYGTDRFFEELFDTFFNINKGNQNHFRNIIEKKLDLTLEDINAIIDIYIEWEDMDYPTGEDACAMKFIWDSRYSRYSVLVFVFLFKFRYDEQCWDNMFLFVRQLSKIYFFYSIRFEKAIKHIHEFTQNDILKYLMSSDSTMDNVMKILTDKINSINKQELRSIISGDIIENMRAKYLICRLSAMLHEEYLALYESHKGVFDKILWGEIDVEHIQSYNDKDEKNRDRIRKEWQDNGVNVNSLGNLMILERSINRSISNKSYKIKMESENGYKRSEFRIVQNQITQYDEWTPLQGKERKDNEINKILNYIFEDNYTPKFCEFEAAYTEVS